MNKTFFNTVVVGVDFSPYSKVVARQAHKLAEAYATNLVFVHVLKQSYHISENLIYWHLQDEVQQLLERQVITFYQLIKYAIPPQVVVTSGQPFDRIVSISKKYPEP